MPERLWVDVGPAGPVNDAMQPRWATVHREPEPDLRGRLERRAAEGDPDARRILTAVQRREVSERGWLDMRLEAAKERVIGDYRRSLEPVTTFGDNGRVWRPPPPATLTEALEHAVAVAVGGDPHRPDRLCRLCVRADELGMWQPLLGLTLGELT